MAGANDCRCSRDQRLNVRGRDDKAALERFFESHTHGILWSVPHAVAVWRVAGSPAYYMMEPHACGPTGLRVDAQDDGAACVLTFTSPKLMAFA
ncbi:hypothetical protein evm_010970 [Chilo suppressalis]|nr:hypothetical protein evm_010970 [Chilo suppressalis]